jgi:hypothetical protein
MCCIVAGRQAHYQACAATAVMHDTLLLLLFWQTNNIATPSFISVQRLLIVGLRDALQRAAHACDQLLRQRIAAQPRPRRHQQPCRRASGGRRQTLLNKPALRCLLLLLRAEHNFKRHTFAVDACCAHAPTASAHVYPATSRRALQRNIQQMAPHAFKGH